MNAPRWFRDHGVHVFPVHGKEPAVPRGTSWRDWRGDVTRLRDYAVELGSLGVLDTDAPDHELWVRVQIANRAIPDTPFFVETARGVHRYYLPGGPLPKFIHRDGHTIELRNVGQYVVGPGSRHPSGVTYTASDWSWRWNDIPQFPANFLLDDRPPKARGSLAGEPFELPERVRAGERHDQLFRLLRSCKAKGWDRITTRDVVTLANAHRCHPPLTEDDAFERWFSRAWSMRDRAFDGLPSFSTLQRAWLDER